MSADPDGDGISNLLEFVLDGDPTTGSDSDFYPSIDSSGETANYQFERRLDSIEEVDVEVLYSEDLRGLAQCEQP